MFKTFISLFSARACDLIKAIAKQRARIMLSAVNDEVYPTASINRTNNGRWRTFHLNFALDISVSRNLNIKMTYVNQYKKISMQVVTL